MLYKSSSIAENYIKLLYNPGKRLKIVSRAGHHVAGQQVCYLHDTVAGAELFLGQYQGCQRPQRRRQDTEI